MSYDSKRVMTGIDTILSLSITLALFKLSLSILNCSIVEWNGLYECSFVLECSCFDAVQWFGNGMYIPIRCFFFIVLLSLGDHSFRGDSLKSSYSITAVFLIHNETRASLPFVCFGSVCFQSHPDVIDRMSIVIRIEDDPNRNCFLLIVLRFLIVLV